MSGRLRPVTALLVAVLAAGCGGATTDVTAAGQERKLTEDFAQLDVPGKPSSYQIECGEPSEKAENIQAEWAGVCTGKSTGQPAASFTVGYNEDGEFDFARVGSEAAPIKSEAGY